MMGAPDDRRAYPRAPLEAICDLEVEGKLHAGILRDVSAGGAWVETDVPLPYGGEIEVRFLDAAATPAWLRARLVRTIAGQGAGVEVVSAPEEYYCLLYALMV